jgi:hypothetical protein
MARAEQDPVYPPILVPGATQISHTNNYLICQSFYADTSELKYVTS